MARGVVVGIDQLTRRLKALESMPESRELAHAFRTAAFIAENAVYARTPVGKTGNLRKGLKSDNLPRPEIGAYVGIRAKHAHLLESGTRERIQKTTGRRTGRGPQTKFFSKGVNTGHRRFRPYIVSEIQRIVLAKAKS